MPDLKQGTTLPSLFPHHEDLLFHNQVSDLQVSMSKPLCGDRMRLRRPWSRGEVTAVKVGTCRQPPEPK